MAIESVATDVAITWLAAVGCGYFLWQLRARDDRHAHKALAFLVGVMAALLLVRGFAWWLEPPWLNRIVQVVASLLPLASTLFCEQVLRRHHPLWLKWLALATTVVFVLVNLFGFGVDPVVWLFAFMACFAVVIAANGAYLLTAGRDQLGAGEIRLARTLVLVSLLSVPLLLSDFRTLHQQVPVRLGGLAALLFVHVMLSAGAQQITQLPWRLLGWLLAAAVLAGVFAVVGGGDRSAMIEHFWRFLPVAYAWLLLAAIVVLGRGMAASNRINDFLRWLGRAPITSLADLLAALRDYPPTQDHLALSGQDLSGYDLDRLWSALAGADDAPVSIAWARSRASGGDVDERDAAEQWLDLLERHQMTHALPVSRQQPLIVLLNLPVTASGSVAELRAGVILRLARAVAGAAA